MDEQACIAFGCVHTGPDAVAILLIPIRSEAIAVIAYSSAAGTADPRRLSEACWLAMAEASPLGLLISNSEGLCVYTNKAYQKLSGLPAEQSSGEHWSIAIHPEDREPVFSAWQGSASDPAQLSQEVRLLRPDGGVRWVRLHVAALRIGGTANVRHLHTVEDITARKEAEDALRAAEEALLEHNERAQVTLDSIGDAVLTTERTGNVTYLNRVAERLTGWSHERAVGRPLAEVFNIVDGETRRPATNPAERAIDEDKTVGLAIGCVLLRPDGTEIPIEDSAAPIHDRQGRVSGAVIVFHEASQSRTITERMAYMAQHDLLTGLPNRALLRERLGQAIGLARRHGKAVGLLYLDIDNFKEVNDSLGHEKGDQLLRAVSERLLSSVRATDTVCREGGDEFVILLNELEHPEDAGSVAEKVHAAFEIPVLVDGREIDVSTSIGISLFPQHGDSADAMLRKADTAMYRAKADGPGGSRFSSADVNTEVLHRRPVRHAIRKVPSRSSTGGAAREPKRDSRRAEIVPNR